MRIIKFSEIVLKNIILAYAEDVYMFCDLFGCKLV